MLNEQSGANFYRLLGVSRDATGQEIDEAYRALVVAAQKMRRADELTEQLQQAREILLSPQKRAEYDETLPSGIFYWEATQAFTWRPKQGEDFLQTQESLPAEETNNFDSTRATVQELEQLAPVGYEGNLREGSTQPVDVPRGFVQAAGMGCSSLEVRPINHYLATRRAMPALQTNHHYHDQYRIDLTCQSVLDIRTTRDTLIDRMLLGIALGMPIITTLGAAILLMNQQ